MHSKQQRFLYERLVTNVFIIIPWRFETFYFISNVYYMCSLMKYAKI